MCGFSHILYTECGHEDISSTAQNTLLCDYARMFHLVQGIDCAPAICIPSVDTPTRIVANQNIFGHCEDCRTQIDLERGGDQRVQQKHAHVNPKATGDYDQQELGELNNLRAYVEGMTMSGMKIAESFEAYLPSAAKVLHRMAHPELQAILSKPGPAKYNNLYLTALKECSNWLPILEAYIQQRAPNKLFADTMLFVFHKAEKAALIMDQFNELAICLNGYQPSSASQSFNGSEARLAYLVNLLLGIHTSIPDAPPQGFFLYEEDFKPSFNTLLTFQIREAVRQAYLNKPMKRAEQKSSRKAAGVLNKNGLTTGIYKGLLPEEPAINIKVEHIPIPDDHDSGIVDKKAVYGVKDPSKREGQEVLNTHPADDKAVTRTSSWNGEQHADPSNHTQSITSSSTGPHVSSSVRGEPSLADDDTPRTTPAASQKASSSNYPSASTRARGTKRKRGGMQESTSRGYGFVYSSSSDDDENQADEEEAKSAPAQSVTKNVSGESSEEKEEAEGVQQRAPSPALSSPLSSLASQSPRTPSPLPTLTRSQPVKKARLTGPKGASDKARSL
ncbi:uncharacterized protein K460DRAFT_359813 [Cucurbitaria berberidis CBS 394.84]|uniref:Uncharacterized protein n=1 Tax=Cucurbitaria berberidis CBS 394.84 TaxID=1168544 RepID=A0A9P4G7E7_9PLEO|nr:uncharacterized protein K460DRAFT_359813 [Cucurbitaria berberidis CBS 394.84]KAF1840085.1 hypothetical protein K460DRAFT_359813 [Cucurbitaria berberidis CBS 394.84]